MVVVDVGVGGSVPLSDDALDLLVSLQLLRLALAVDLERFEVFAAGVGVLEDALLVRPNDLDVVLDALEALEPLEVLVRLPCVVNVTVVLPLDEEAEVSRRFVLLVLDWRNPRVSGFVRLGAAKGKRRNDHARCSPSRLWL